MNVRSTRASVAIAVLGLAACNAFPDSLLKAIESPDGGGATASDSGGSGAPDASIDAPGTDGSTSLASRYAAEVMRDGPLVYLRLNDKEGAAVARDESGHGHDGQYAGLGLAFGINGALADDTAVSFVDGSGMIKMPPEIDFDGFKSFSVEVWFRTRPNNTQIGYVVDHQQYDPSRTGWALRVGDATNFERWLNGAGVNAIGKAAPPPEQWHHLVAVFAGTPPPAQQSLYLDGQKIDDGGSDSSLPPLGTTFTIGHQNCNCGDATAFIGDLDELAIYDKALTSPAIQRHYAARQ